MHRAVLAEMQKRHQREPGGALDLRERHAFVAGLEGQPLLVLVRGSASGRVTGRVREPHLLREQEREHEQQSGQQGVADHLNATDGSLGTIGG